MPPIINSSPNDWAKEKFSLKNKTDPKTTKEMFRALAKG